MQTVWDDWIFWMGLVYVTFPLNFFVYGWNDIVDHPIDKANPRKDTWLFGARASLDQLKKVPVPMVLVQVPFLTFFLLVDLVAGLITIAGIFGVNFLYNDRRVALRSRPPFDLINPLGYLILLYLGVWLNQTLWVPWQAVVYLGMFCMHAHLMGEVMDYYADKASGRTTSVVRLGMQLSKILIIVMVVAETVLVWWAFADFWLTGFLLVVLLWLLLDLLVLYREGEYTPSQYKLLGVFINISGYGSISYLWLSGSLTRL